MSSLALWSGHSVFPNIYRDMRHPGKYATGLNYIFLWVVSVHYDVKDSMT